MAAAFESWSLSGIENGESVGFGHPQLWKNSHPLRDADQGTLFQRLEFALHRELHTALQTVVVDMLPKAQVSILATLSAEKTRSELRLKPLAMVVRTLRFCR